MNRLEYLLKDIEKALDNELYFIALQSVLTLPDICGSIEYDTNRVGQRYTDWYNTYMNTKVNLTAEQCYGFRCKLLHQGLSQYTQNTLERIVFAYPSNNFFNNNQFIENGKVTVNIDLLTFCHDMINSVRIWLHRAQKIPESQAKLNQLIRIHNGYKNFIAGVPFIG